MATQRCYVRGELLAEPPQNIVQHPRSGNTSGCEFLLRTVPHTATHFKLAKVESDRGYSTADGGLNVFHSPTTPSTDGHKLRMVTNILVRAFQEKPGTVQRFLAGRA